MRVSSMSLGESVTVCFGIPVLLADLPALSPGYQSPAGLGNHPLCPLAYTVCAPGARNVGLNVRNDIVGTVT